MLRIYLKKDEERRIRAGHLWVFSNEIDRIEESAPGERETPGAAAELYSRRGTFLGYGYYNRHTLISFRLLARNRVDDEKELLYRRMLDALHFRELYCGKKEGKPYCGRLIYSEADLLPGLIVDSYGSWLCIQLLTAGMEARRKTLLEILDELLAPRGMILRNDLSIRELEGLTSYVEVVKGDPAECRELEIEYGGYSYVVDLESGQKSGFFFDQEANRRFLGGIVKGLRVLDCFSYTGGWSIHALGGGASHVTLVDSSAEALERAERNLILNGFTHERWTTMKSDVQDALHIFRKRSESFDVVLLDPPAFVKSRRHLKQGLTGYYNLNRNAARAVADGGLLVTSSCSYHVHHEQFLNIVSRAILSTRRHARLFRIGFQAEDHPMLPSLPESLYLKCLFLQLSTP